MIGTKPIPVGAGALRIGQLNFHNLFDPEPPSGVELPTPKQYATHLTKLALTIKNGLGSPDVIAIQEVENERVLKDLANEKSIKNLGYKPVLLPTNDKRGIHVAFLYRPERVDVSAARIVNPPATTKSIPKGQIDQSLLFARAPLIVDVKARGAAQAAEGVQQLQLVVNHFKSKLGGEAMDERRNLQGEFIGGYIDAQRAANPNLGMVVLGDFNALPNEKAYNSIRFRKDGSERVFDAPDLVPAADRYTYIYRGQKNLLDHVFVTPDVQRGIENLRIPHFNSPKESMKQKNNPKTHIGASDHDPIVFDLDWGKIGQPTPPPAVPPRKASPARKAAPPRESIPVPAATGNQTVANIGLHLQ